jgi:GNAT superfamily N-acetyltransferase
MPKRSGRKSASQTPAPLKDRIRGSKVNPKGSASSEKSASQIKFDAKTLSALTNKLKEFKEKHPTKNNITLADLKAVYRRGSGAYSSTHRPTISGGMPNSRNAWSMARVNKFLLKAGGTKVKKAYVQDDDLLKYEIGGRVKSDYTKKIKEAINYVENSPKARMDIDFEDEEGTLQAINEGKDYERIFPLKSKPNSFIVKKIREGVQNKYDSFGVWNEKKKSYDFQYLKNEKYGDKSKEYDTLQIASYDNKGQIVGVIKIAITENKKEDVKIGAFKISVRQDYQNKGIASKLIEKAESEGIDFVEALKNNNFTSKGRWYFISWLNKKLKNKVNYAIGGETDDNKETYKKWRSLVNMSYGELKKFYESKEGKEAGLSSSEANKQGIDSGRESARMIMKMKTTPKSDWTPDMWRWAKKQISFISRMSGNKGGLYDEKGNKTRKHTSLLIWGHNPQKKGTIMFELGGMTKNAVIDEILRIAKPYQEELTQKWAVNFEKEFKREPSKIDIEYYEFGLVVDMVKSVGNYIKDGDSIKNIDNSRGRDGSITISCVIERGGTDYPFSTEVILAGGYNIQILHFRYIVKTKLPRTSSNPYYDKLNDERKKLTKIQKLREDLGYAENSIKKYEVKLEEAKANAKLSDAEVEKLSREEDPEKWRTLETTWETLIERGADKNYNYDIKEFEKSNKEYRESIIKFWRIFNANAKQYESMISREKKEIEKLNKKISELSTKTMEVGGEMDVRMQDTIQRMDNPNFADPSYYAKGGLIAPNGKKSNLTPEQYKLVRTPEFKAWFGDWDKLANAKIKDPAIDEVTFEYLSKNVSKVVDENGEPLVLYHGSRSEFNFFDLKKSGSSNTTAKVGFWFSPLKVFAENFASDIWYGESDKVNVISVFLNIKNPKVYESEIVSQEVFDKLNKQLKEIQNKIQYVSSEWVTGYDYANRMAFDSSERGMINEENFSYYSNLTPKSKDAIKDGEIVRKLNVDRKAMVDKLNDLSFSDSYERFKTDIYKQEGKTSYDANVGGLGMSLSNSTETINKYRNWLNENGYDGIIIKNTRFDKRSAGRKNDQYVSLYPAQIKLADGSNSTFDGENPDIRYENGGLITEDNIEVFGLNNYTSSKKSGRFYHIYAKRKIGDELDENWWIRFSRKDGVNNLYYIENQIMNTNHNIEIYFPKKKLNLSELPVSLLDIYNNPDIRYADGGQTQYHLGGDMSKHLAPNGKPSNLTHEQWHLVRTSEFKAWFGDWENDPENASKVVDENGEPLVVYHYTNSKDIREFYPFAIDLLNGTKTKKDVQDIIQKWKNSESISLMDFRQGTFFTPKRGSYSSYGENEYACFLKGNFIVNTGDFVKGQKYIGNPSMESPIWYYWNDVNPEIVALYPEQIKLADGSNTTFDGSNPNIRYANGGEVDNFKKWFKQSKVVDAKGKPLVVYHGSPDLRGLKSDYVFKPRFDENKSFFFTDSLRMAKSYADPKRAYDYQNAEEGVISVYLSIQNPLIVDAQNQIWRKFRTEIDGIELVGTAELIKYSKSKNYDGVIVNNVRDYYNNNENIKTGGNVYVVFEPTQIKLADGTNSTFNSDNPDIRFKNGGSLFKSQKTIQQIAKEKNVPLSYAKEQLKMGIKVESEHSDNAKVQNTIALQHLDEDMNYYKKLKTIEN